MANLTDWGLTDRGFRRPEYADLLDAFEHEARDLFGHDANLTVRSPLGMFLRIFAWFGSRVFAALEDVYNARFIDTASGASLYNVGRAIGLQLLPAQRASGYLLITGQPGTVIQVGWLVANIENVQYVTAARAVIGPDGAVRVPARAVLPGPDGNAPPDTLTDIVNPCTPAGIISVTNPERFDGGRIRETDEQYRDRYYHSVDFAGGVNAEAIAAEILQNVPGVLSAIVFENDMDYTDMNGLPPHSIEAVVYGGLDEDVARHIFRRKAAGIQTFGGLTVQVFAENGLLYDISFSRPYTVPVWVKLWGLVTDPASFPADGGDRIKRALADYVGGTGAKGLAIGGEVIYKRLPAIVYTVPGVLDFEMTISPDGVNYSYQNIPISPRQKAVCDESRVTINA